MEDIDKLTTRQKAEILGIDIDRCNNQGRIIMQTLEALKFSVPEAVFIMSRLACETFLAAGMTTEQGEHMIRACMADLQVATMGLNGPKGQA